MADFGPAVSAAEGLLERGSRFSKCAEWGESGVALLKLLQLRGDHGSTDLFVGDSDAGVQPAELLMPAGGEMDVYVPIGERSCLDVPLERNDARVLSVPLPHEVPRPPESVAIFEGTSHDDARGPGNWAKRFSFGQELSSMGPDAA